MSESEEEENYSFFGKPLQPYDEDAFPKKKPIAIEDQVAKDAQGRRRFHGAFTGGFSAGFFNTVGSLEGWTPKEFKSTRQDKAKASAQRPEDFMDDEDIGEHGIAPQTVRATKEYSTSKKRGRVAFADGPIPGEPVLHSLLTSGNETIGYLLLKNIGIQGKIEDRDRELELESNTRVIGCEMPRNNVIELPKATQEKQYEIHQLYQDFLKNPKTNTFGLGYEGLDRSHINLFKSNNLVVTGKNNKKLSIAGQAFGVGAFEDDDEDIYVKDDMSKYDFELTAEKKKQAKETKTLILEMFVHSPNVLLNKKKFKPPIIPASFTGKHKVKKSRFEPIKTEPVDEPEPEDRSKINATIRAKYLGEPTRSEPVITNEPQTVETSMENSVSERKPAEALLSNLLLNKFVSAGQSEDVTNILEPVARSETEHGTEEQRGAVKLKMFGALTRVSFDWSPAPVLCKRFNVPEPNLDRSELRNQRKRTKNLIFEYQKHDDDIKLAPGLNKTLETKTETISIEEPPPIQQDQPQASTSTSQPEEIPRTTIKAEPDAEPERPKDITERVHVENNIDLFRAVFLDSSESEEEPEEKPEERQAETKKLVENVLSEELIPKIRPLKQGILSGVEFKPRVEQKSPKLPEVQPASPEPNLYGPKLPASRVFSSNPVEKIVLSSDDEWVEKDKKKKKDKKHKKSKKKKDKKR